MLLELLLFAAAFVALANKLVKPGIAAVIAAIAAGLANTGNKLADNNNGLVAAERAEFPLVLLPSLFWAAA